MSRLFVAVWPPPEVIDRLNDLPRTPTAGVRWTRPDQWHITLRFLGPVDDAAAVAAFRTVRAAATTAVMGPAVEPLGTGVVTVPVAGLGAVAAAVADATSAIEDPADRLPFVGHLTIARLRAGAIDGLTGHPFAASFPVDEIALVRSDRDDTGVRYTTVTTHRLAP